MLFVVRGFTPVALIAAVALCALASAVSGSFAAIVWICAGGNAVAAFAVGALAVPAALAAAAAWSIGSGAYEAKTGRTRRPGVWELDEERALRRH